MFDWSKIHTVLLDMDGTLLDLHFDNHFWMEHLPKRYANHAQISLEQAHVYLKSRYEQVEGTISWYCLDYWAEQIQMPITELKREVQHLIKLRDDAHDFLVALKNSGREVILVTNAHPDSLSLKIERTQLHEYFDQLISCHQFGVTKESQLLWQRLQQHIGFDNENTLFVDDSINILDSAKNFGIKHLLAVANPDSKQANREITEYPAITDYSVLLNDIKNPFQS
ncbi:GMP/IMP nucleotidase [Thalassotalea nanhaiensis]|uniref:GMP/IMP nucleotidase n=1 Tax=Thalassotalea nanhaiensis TaxID=3065648 RepID=A0ABY9TJG5_9GAMM|nr:GMP/IMP nucleotidase [Colwelliaceae bacterium SQ345]